MNALLFDALGTLVGIEPPWPRLCALLVERYGIVVDADVAAGAVGAEMLFYRANCSCARDAESLLALRVACTDVLAGELGPVVADVPRGELMDVMLESFVFVSYPDVVEGLARLAGAGVPLAVVSNWDVSLHDVLADLGLSEHIGAVLTSAEHGTAKPDPSIFVAALERLGCSGGTHVGDSVAEDVAGAQAAGLEPVLLVRGPSGLLGARGEAAPGGVRAISTLEEL